MNRALRRLMEQSQRRQDARIQRGTEAPTPMNRAARREQKRAEQRIQRQQRREDRRTGETPLYERERMQRDRLSRQVVEAQRQKPSPIQQLKEAQATRDSATSERISTVQRRLSPVRVINTPEKKTRQKIWDSLSDDELRQLGQEYEERWERWDSRNEMEPMGSSEAVEDFVDSF